MEIFDGDYKVIIRQLSGTDLAIEIHKKGYLISDSYGARTDDYEKKSRIKLINVGFLNYGISSAG